MTDFLPYEETKIALIKQLKSTTYEGFNDKNFETLKDTIKEQYYKSQILSGDPVGIKTGYAIAAPTMQMTLNSVDHDTSIIIKEDGIVKPIKIGVFIDHDIIEAGYLNIEAKNIEVPSINETGDISWKKVIA